MIGGILSSFYLGLEELSEQFFSPGFEIGARDIGDLCATLFSILSLKQLNMTSNPSKVSIFSFFFPFAVAPKIE